MPGRALMLPAGAGRVAGALQVGTPVAPDVAEASAEREADDDDDDDDDEEEETLVTVCLLSSGSAVISDSTCNRRDGSKQ